MASTIERYTLIQKLLHWLIALAVIGALGVGTLLEYLDSGAFKNQLYALHKATGMAILGLMVLRITARIVFGAPPLPIGVPSWQRTAAGASHFLLYALILLMPVVGWAATSAFPAPIPFFGLFDVPPLIGADRDLSKQLFSIHSIMGKIIFAIVAIHIAAALHHGLSRKDGVLRRIWF
jgi:cytochrome b561